MSCLHLFLPTPRLTTAGDKGNRVKQYLMYLIKYNMDCNMNKIITVQLR